LFNMGLDSLMALELMVLLEKNLGITLTESLVFEHPTIEELVAYFLRELLLDQTRVSQTLHSAAEQPEAAPPVLAGADPLWQEQVQAVSSLSEEELLRQLRGEG
ncbi:MAG: acyl carrier protein, partial [Cyanobacteria bacterium K_DeepCast_0m_m1_088]|nr:acyl carrier protein [Cyanobacteria bacterium K_DeepCast_0m_m1_088]